MDPSNIAAVHPDRAHEQIWALQLYIVDMIRMCRYSYRGSSDTQLAICLQHITRQIGGVGISLHILHSIK